MSNKTWYDGLLQWFQKWLKTYESNVTEAYRIINRELIPTRQYERALIWCLHVFDVTVLTHQMMSLVHETEDQEIRSVYYFPIDGLVDILKRLENQMIQCRNMFDELLTLDSIDRMYMTALSMTTPSEKVTMIQPDNMTCESIALPTGVALYTPDSKQGGLITDIIQSVVVIDQHVTDMAMSLELLRAGSDRATVHAENLDQRLPPCDVRAIFLAVAPGDGELARTMVESYLAKLRETVDGVRTYRVDYGSLLSKWKGASEKNFENLMQWMVERAQSNAVDGQGFDVLWFDNVHVLMGQRTSSNGADDPLSVIKTTMLQIMDIFNKDKRLSRFALLFSTGAAKFDVDSAFLRRMDSIYEFPRLSRSQAFRDLMIRHTLRVTRINVENEALARLNDIDNLSALQNLVYMYYVRVRFQIGTEFYIAETGTPGYSLQPLKEYFNLNGDVVRTGSPSCKIVQAVGIHKSGNTILKRNRRFYRPGEADPRNLTRELSANTVYVLQDISDTEEDL